MNLFSCASHVTYLGRFSLQLGLSDKCVAVKHAELLKPDATVDLLANYRGRECFIPAKDACPTLESMVMHILHLTGSFGCFILWGNGPFHVFSYRCLNDELLQTISVHLARSGRGPRPSNVLPPPHLARSGRS